MHIITLHQDLLIFKRELLIDQHKRPLLSDRHLQALQELEPLTLQVEPVDTEWVGVHSKTAVHSNLEQQPTKENTLL